MFHWIETSSKVILMEPSDFPTRETVYAKIRADLDQYGWSLISSIYRDELFTHTVGLSWGYEHQEIELIVEVELPPGGSVRAAAPAPLWFQQASEAATRCSSTTRSPAT